MLYTIEQLDSPNFEDRRGYKPIVIVNHITDGQEAVRDSDEHEEMAVQNTFMSPNSQASSHFEILRDGRIKQYVDIQNAAWTQGLHSLSEIEAAPSPIVRQMGCNPNLYCISKEFQAYKDHGGYGNITEAQYWAGLWLDKFIQSEVKRIYGHTLQLNNSFVIGHSDIDPVNRPYDPGPQFPWVSIYNELAIAQNMTLADYEGRLKYLQSDQYKMNKCLSVMNEVDYLKDVANGVYGQDDVSWGKDVFRTLYKAFNDQGVLTDTYTDTDDFAHFHNDVLYFYESAQGKNGKDQIDWGTDQLCTMYPYMLQNGLVTAV